LRVLKVDENEKPKSSKWKTLGFISTVGIIIFGFIFVSAVPGLMFNLYIEEDSTGWADIKVFSIAFNGSIVEIKNGCTVDLYYAKNGSIYQEGLELNDFPIKTPVPLTFLINSTSGEFQYKYSMLFGNDDPNQPYVNEVILKREALLAMIELQTTIVNFTYENYFNPDLLNPNISAFELSFNDTNPIEFQFGTHLPNLIFDVSGLAHGYTWGASTIIPHSVFEQEKDLYPIAYQNGYNRIGLNLAFDTNINLSKLLYGSEAYNFFVSIQVFEINLTTGINPEKLWVAPLPDIDMDIYQSVFTFETESFFDNIYLWSGHLDEYNESFSYNYYSLMEV